MSRGLGCGSLHLGLELVGVGRNFCGSQGKISEKLLKQVFAKSARFWALGSWQVRQNGRFDGKYFSSEEGPGPYRDPLCAIKMTLGALRRVKSGLRSDEAGKSEGRLCSVARRAIFALRLPKRSKN